MQYLFSRICYFHFFFATVPYSKFSEDHMYRGTVWSSWCPLTCLQYHIRGDFIILWSISDMRSNWLKRHEYLVLQSIYFFIVFRPPHAIVISPSRMLNFRLLSSTIETTWNMHAGSLMYLSLYLGCPVIMQVVVIICVVWSDPLIIRDSETQYSL